jgi:hypothetical protein
LIYNPKVYFGLLLGGVLFSLATAAVHYTLFLIIGYPTQIVLSILGYVWGSQKEDSKR